MDLRRSFTKYTVESIHQYSPARVMSKDEIGALFDDHELAEPCTPRTSADRKRMGIERELEKCVSLFKRKSLPSIRRNRSIESKTNVSKISTHKRACSMDATSIRQGKAFHFHDGELIDVKSNSLQSPRISLAWEVSPSMQSYMRHSFGGNETEFDDLLSLGRYSLPADYKL